MKAINSGIESIQSHGGCLHGTRTAIVLNPFSLSLGLS
jgi:hypothetical protein